MWIPKDLRPIRWTGVVIIVVVALTGSSLRWWHICKDQLAATGNLGVVTVCQPPGLVDLPVIAALLLCLILIAPELSEVGVPGLLSIKRKLNDQQDQIAEQSESLGRQQGAIESLQSTMDQVVQTVQAVNVQQAQEQAQKQVADQKALQKQDIRLIINNAAQKSDLSDRPISEAQASREEIDPRRAQMESQLLRAWERLQQWTGDLALPFIYGETSELSGGSWIWRTLDRYLTPSLLESNEPVRTYVEKQRTWNQKFAEEINIARTARNTVAHPRQDTTLSDEKLSEALQLADVLIRSAERDLRESRERALTEGRKQLLELNLTRASDDKGSPPTDPEGGEITSPEATASAPSAATAESSKRD
jgi:hypothetical protein